MLANGYQHVVGQDAGIEELENAVFGSFNGGNKTGKTGKRRTQVFAWFAKNPPVIPVCGTVVLIPLGLDPVQQPLKNRRVLATQLLGGQPKGINDLDTTRCVGQVTAIAVVADQEVAFCAAALSRSEREQGSSLGWGNDETNPVQLDTR
ncbi:MAG: hypothetical protein ACOYNF_17595 [Rhodoferax sp.]